MVEKDGQSGVLKRGFRLGKLGLSLTGSYLGYQAQNLFLGEEKRKERQRRFQLRACGQVRAELASLKGAAMKLGQLLSLQTHTLSTEAIEELAQLQMFAPGMHPWLARAQFKASCGKYPDEVFKSFEAEPFAAASLGQVHKAITGSGERVAVKIQYPAIRTAIENDFKLLRSVTLPVRLSGHIPGAILDEVRRGFLEETDYLQEGKNIDFFRKRLAHFSWLNIPKVHWALTTDRVLTMSFVEGSPVGDFLKSRPPRAVCDLIGNRLFELYYFQVHRLKTLHADHHPGNYLFQPGGQIGMVDFGCVKGITFDASDLIRCCVARTWSKGPRQAQHVLKVILGQQVAPAKARKLLAALDEMVDILFPLPDAAEQLADFGEAKLLRALTRALQAAVRDKLTNPEFAFISRAELGLYSLAHQLRARINGRAVWGRVDGAEA